MKVNDRRLSHLLSKLSMLMKQVTHLKHLRRKLYRTVDGIKKSWFGWLSNRKAETARYYHAVVVREDLTILAKEKGSSDYKGRTFNKMLNNGAKGQYLRLASQKLRWFGIPEMVVPSYYTSCTDITCGVVDKKQRRTQDRFVGQNGVSQQADIHAALTLALYPLLRPKSVNAKEIQVFPNQQVNGNVYQEVNASINQVTNISISG
jgi:transposase